MRTSYANQAAYDLLYDKFDSNIRAVVFAEDFDAPTVPHELRSYYGGDAAVPRGYALLVDGSALVDGTSDTSHLLSMNTGGAFGRYRITSPESPDEIEARWRKAHDEGALPRINPLLSNQSVGAYTLYDPNAVREQNYLVVTANDAPAALHMMESVRAQPRTLDELYGSEQYVDLIRSSAHVRDQLAEQTASALGIKIDRTADLVTPTHHILPARESAHQSSVALSTDIGGVGQYVVHNDTTDTASAHAGVLVHQGPMGGFAQVSRSKPFMLATGVPTRAWQTATMSVLGVNAPHHEGDGSSSNGRDASTGGEAALHRNTSHESRRMHDNKVHWSGTLSTAHPRSDERRSLITQALVHKVAKPQEPGVELRVVPMKMIAVQLADHEPPVAQTLPELAALAKQSKAASLPVPLNSDAMRDLTRHFDKLTHAREELADVMNNSVRVPLDELHTVRSACNAKEKDHYHYWYDHVYAFDKERDALLDEEDNENAGDVDETEDVVEEAGPLINYAKPLGERLYSTANANGKSKPSTLPQRTHERIKSSSETSVSRHQTRVMLGTKLITELNEIVQREKQREEKAATKAATAAAAQLPAALVKKESTSKK